MEENRNEVPVLTLNPFEEMAKQPEAPAVSLASVMPEQKAEVEAAKEELRAAVEKDDLEAIKTKMKALDEVLHRISEKLYQEAQAAGPQGTGAAEPQGGDEDIVDADFTEES